MDLHPSSHVGPAHLAEALEFAGRTSEALLQYQLAATRSDAPVLRANQARFLAHIGRTAEALSILDDLQSSRDANYVDAYHIALLLDALGRREEAFQELQRAYEEKSYTLLFSKVDPKADGLRSDSRFVELQNKLFGASMVVASGAD